MSPRMQHSVVRLKNFSSERLLTRSLTSRKSRGSGAWPVPACARRIILGPKSLRAESVPNKLRLRKNSIDRKAFSLLEFSGETNDGGRNYSKRRKTAGGLG